jgi:UDP-N-acetylmuramate--alanine ligase
LPSDAECVVHSAAIPADNPECCAARMHGLPVVSYPVALGELMSDRKVLAVAGTHGKSSTAMYLVSILRSCGIDAGYILGAAFLDGTPAGYVGQHPWCVVEACEYRSHFLALQPEHLILTGIEPDHFDAFPTDAEMDTAYSRFVRRMKPSGTCVFNYDSGRAVRVVASLPSAISVGVNPAATWSIENANLIQQEYRLVLRGASQELPLRVRQLGRHNTANAAAAAVLAIRLGLNAQEIARGIAAAPGLARRCQIFPEKQGIIRVDDYAHHPTAIASTLASVREWCAGRRLVVLFQPHQIGRTARLLDELAASLQNVEVLGIADIWRAREPDPRPGDVTAADLAARVRQLGGNVLPQHSPTELAQAVRRVLQPDDVLITMGAGQLGSLAHILDERL